MLNYAIILLIMCSIASTIVSAGKKSGRKNNLEHEESEFYPSSAPGRLCGKTCSCPAVAQECDPGTSMVTDGCGCCKICARQHGESCNERDICDKHRGLYCDMASGTCKVSPGRDCMIENKLYKNGDIFQPSCRVKCWCIDGSMGCVPMCKPPPVNNSLPCSHPRLMYPPSKCCGEWQCIPGDKPYIEQLKQADQNTVTRRGNCMVQTTQWSECSKSCGFGVSDRVTNDNELCKLKKEVRLCMVRPCSVPKPKKSKGRACRRTLHRRSRIQFSLSGCVSRQSYRPKYCGTCSQPGLCCRPKTTKTIKVTFDCDSNSKRRRSVAPDTDTNSTAVASTGETTTFEKNMMWIIRCTCDENCPRENDIFAFSYRGSGKDTWGGKAR